MLISKLTNPLRTPLCLCFVLLKSICIFHYCLKVRSSNCAGKSEMIISFKSIVVMKDKGVWGEAGWLTSGDGHTTLKTHEAGWLVSRCGHSTLKTHEGEWGEAGRLASGFGPRTLKTHEGTWGRVTSKQPRGLFWQAVMRATFRKEPTTQRTV